LFSNTTLLTKTTSNYIILSQISLNYITQTIILQGPFGIIRQLLFLLESITLLYISNIPNILSGISIDLNNIQVILDPCVSRTIERLVKVYNKDKKYSGELYDILATKLLNFYDIYSKLDIDRY
jgi:hypothetical protein